MPPKRHADPLEVVAARAPAPAAAGHVPDADPDAALLALGFQKFQRMEAKGALILLWRNQLTTCCLLWCARIDAG
jgi:hypothetical protein